MPWPERLSLRAENLRMDLVVVKDVYLGIRFSVCHIVSVLWHIGGLRKLALGFVPNFKKIRKHLVDGNTSKIFPNNTIFPVVTC